MSTGNSDFVKPRHGGDIAGRVLQAHGVTHVFTLSGGHIAPVLVGAETLGIKVVDVRDEATTVGVGGTGWNGLDT